MPCLLLGVNSFAKEQVQNDIRNHNDLEARLSLNKPKSFNANTKVISNDPS
jgi:hypothetical protein